MCSLLGRMVSKTVLSWKQKCFLLPGNYFQAMRYIFAWILVVSFHFFNVDCLWAFSLKNFHTSRRVERRYSEDLWVFHLEPIVISII